MCVRGDLIRQLLKTPLCFQPQASRNLEMLWGVKAPHSPSWTTECAQGTMRSIVSPDALTILLHAMKDDPLYPRLHFILRIRYIILWMILRTKKRTALPFISLYRNWDFFPSYYNGRIKRWGWKYLKTERKEKKTHIDLFFYLFFNEALYIFRERDIGQRHIKS